MPDSSIRIEPVMPPPQPAENGSDPVAPLEEEWLRSKDGKFEYVTKGPGERGVLRRQDGESVEEARARFAAGTERRPRREKPPKMPDAPKRLDSRELEASLTMALKAPGALAMTLAKDEWLPEHFNMTAPVLSRQIILASEHNPWLRRRIEEAATGQDAMWAVISLVGMGTALFSYAVPPIVYVFNLPVPPAARARWGMPDKPLPPYAATAPTPRPEEPVSAPEPEADIIAA